MLLKDEVSTVPAVNKIENLTAPKFKNLDSMYKTVSKYTENMIKLKCEAEGNPLPNITWYKDGVTPPRRQIGGNITYIQWAIILEDLTILDSGNYTCEVINEYGFIDFIYKVKVKKRNKKRQPDVTTLEHTNASFKCNLISDRLTPKRWLHHEPRFQNVNDVNLNYGTPIQVLKHDF
ncbi:fibroblast growth factor receptor-like 1 [Aphis gossypii]|uniref:fibroblast growth factor receptor-like 1 n=1 Tax=Aphis gossypii TaxID=80765 RepID=UPI002158C739|nr:fibroblast growth factor receptor-like 1 [Aphis gossypii]